MKKRCDRCTCVVGLYEFESGKWRCPACIWIERLKLLKACKMLVAAERPTPLRRAITMAQAAINMATKHA